jgi:hypothetical protein
MMALEKVTMMATMMLIARRRRLDIAEASDRF